MAQTATKTKSKKKPTRKNTRRKNRYAAKYSNPEKFDPDLRPQLSAEESYKGSLSFAWLGSGQCGGRLVKSFHELGYQHCLAVNTTHHDLDLLEIDPDCKFLMDIGPGGAGKNIKQGAKAIAQHRQQILHLMEKNFGSKIDHIMICFGAGGGTGSGSAPGLIDLAKNFARRIGLKNPDRKVGAVMTLPTDGEAKSPCVAANAYTIASELAELAANAKISPLIIIDNAKISAMYPKLTVKAFWPTINNTVTGMFDIFNRLSALPSQYTSFDPTDYQSIISAGGSTIMGLTQAENYKDKLALSASVKNNLETTLLADGFDLASAQTAGCIAVAGSKIISHTPGLQDNIDYAFDTFADITGNATLHRGIYEDCTETFRLYTIIGGLNPPTERLKKLKH